MATLPAWRPATAYAKSATVRPVASPGAEPVPLDNGDFEDGDTAWTKDAGWAISSGSAFEGTWKAIFTGAGSGTIVAAGTYPATAGQVIAATVKAKVLNAADGATAFLKWYDASNALISTTTGLESSVESGVWMQLAVTGTGPANAAFVVFGVEATRSVGASVTIDDARWDYSAPIEARRVAYRAVQEAAGVSGAVEPTWPSALGGQVVDGTVTWEAVELPWIEWTANPIIESGLTEPAWPTTVGAFIRDNTANWECVSRRVEDENCPNTKVVAIMASKVFAADRDIIRFSATANPLDWTTRDDAGYLPSGLQQANSNDMAVLQPYRGNLGAWNANGFQMWQVDPDPSQMALLDQMDGVGSTHTLAATAVGNDLYFVAAPGVRSVGIANAAENLQAGDVGMPIDVLVQAAIVQAAIDNQKMRSTYWPGMGQYWLWAADDGVTAGAGGALALACPVSFNITVGDSYSYTYVATGGTAPYTFSVVSGTLPPGLTLNASTGVLSGTVTTPGSYSYGVKVTDALGVEAFCGWAAEVLEDVGEVASLYLLVTGNAKADGVVWASAEATAAPTFTGLDPGTGADMTAAIGGYYDGVWAAVAESDARYSLNGMATWQTGTLSTASGGVRFVGGAGAGWLAMSDAGSGGGYSRHREAAVTPTAYTSLVAGDYSGPGGLLSSWQSSESAFVTGGKYYTGYQYGLYVADAPGGPWNLLAYGPGPGGAAVVVNWLDGVMVGSTLYAVTLYHFDIGSHEYQVRKSATGGVTWPDGDILVSILASTGTALPMQIAYDDVNDEVVVLCHDGKVWTSANGWASAIDTGLTMPGNMEPFSGGMNQGAGKKIACAAGYTYVIGAQGGNDDKCVVSANSGLSFGSPITMPIQDAKSITVGSGP